MRYYYLIIIYCTYCLNVIGQTINTSNTTGEASIQKFTPQVPSIQSGERFSYIIEFQNLNSNNSLVITDVLPQGLCFTANDIRANNSFVDFNGAPIASPNTIANLIDTSALPTVVFNIPTNVQSGSFTITVSFCAGVTPDGFTVTNNICGDYTTNAGVENFCTTQGLTSTARAVNPWGQITKEPVLPAVSDATGNAFVSSNNGIANYRIVVSKLPAFQGITFGMLNLENVTITEIASPPCAVVSLVSGPGVYNNVTNQIELNDDLLGDDPFSEVVFVVQVDYGPCGTLAEGQTLSNRVELNGTPVGLIAQDNIADDTASVTATVTLPAPDQSSIVTKTIIGNDIVPGCQARYDISFTNTDNRSIAPYEIVDTMPSGLIPDSYQVIGSVNDLSVNQSFDVFINGVFDRSFSLPDDNFSTYPWNGASGDVIRVVAQNDTELYPGDSITIAVLFTIDSGTAIGTLITNCVDFNADIILNDAANIATGNQSCVDLIVQPPSMDVCVAKTVRPADVNVPFASSIGGVAPNDELEFNICVQNNGSLSFNGSMQDVLDPKYEFISVDNSGMPAGTTFTQSGQLLTWNNLTVVETCDVFNNETGCAIEDPFFCATVRVRVRPFTVAGNIDNAASLIDTSGSVLASSDFAKVNIIDIAVFVITKELSIDGINFQSNPLVVDPNCDLTIFYRIRVTNIGNKVATDFILFDELPAIGDVLYPTNLSRNSTFSFDNVSTSTTDFNVSYVNLTPSSSINPSNFVCGSVPAGNASFNPSSSTIRLANSSDLLSNNQFEAIIQATIPNNNLTSIDQAVNSAYVVNCDINSNIISSSSITSPAVIDIEKTVEAGGDATIDICSDSNPIQLLDQLVGSPDTTGTWSPLLSSGTGIFDPSIDPAGIYTYTVIGTPACSTDTSQVTVTVTQQANPGTDTTITVCSSDASLDLFTVLNGTPDSGGIWSPTLSSGTSMFDPAVDPAGDYTYTLTGPNSCLDTSATVTVTVTPAPDPGIDGAIVLCTSDLPIDLTTALNGTPDTDGNWTPALISGTNQFNPALDPAGDYTYTVSRGNCMDETATVQVSFNPDVNIATPANLSECDIIGDNDGLTQFNLDAQSIIILNGLNPTDHTITYHQTINDAINGANALNLNHQNSNLTETIFARVEQLSTGCFNTVQFTVTGILSPMPQLQDEYQACFDESGIPINPSRLPVLDTQLSNSSYQFRWFFEGDEIIGSTQNSFTVNALGNYTVEVTDIATGCTSIDTTTVIPEPPLRAQAQLITDQFDNNPVIVVNVLNNTGDQYWYRLDSGPWQRSNRFVNPDPGIRTVSVKGPNSCGVAIDDILVLKYPRFFTPNADGFNDYWQIENLTDAGNRLYIFNRHGKLLKQLSLLGVGWDGTYNNQPLPSTDYWFVLEYTDPNTGRTAVLRSHFSLKR